MKNLKKLLLITLTQLKQNVASRKMKSAWLAIAMVLAVILVGVVWKNPAALVINFIIFLGLSLLIINNYLQLISEGIELELKKQQLQTITEHLKDGVIIYDANLKILNFNRAAEEIFQLPAKEIIGKYIDPALIKNLRFKPFIQVMFPSLAPSVNQISESGTWPQIINLSLDEFKLELQVTVHRLTDKAGKLLGFFKIVKDITREKMIIQMRSEFIEVAAHQLRTPLTAIKWSLENLISLTAEKQLKDLEEMLNQTAQIAERAIKITNDFLDAAKIEEGRFGYTFEDIDLIELIKNILNVVLPVAKQYGVQIFFDNGGLTTLQIHADPGRLGTVFLNLLDNAIKYNIKNGRVAISIKKIEERPYARITIEDTGIGIAPEDENKIFQKLYRGSNAKKIEADGSGLGLYIAQNIVRRHGGDIGFSSTLNRGTTFWFTLPLDPKLVPTKEITYEEY